MNQEEQYDLAKKKYKVYWEKRTPKQIEKEIVSWQKYFNKHGSAYAWHGKDMTPPGSLSDGDQISILKEIINSFEVEKPKYISSLNH